MTETRYWQRVGFRVTKIQAFEMVDKMKDGVSGKVMDDEIDEYVNVDSVDSYAATQEIEDLFNGEDSEQALDDDNASILALMEFESGRKTYLKAKVAEGMEMADAKLAYDAEKADMVRISLGLPEPELLEEE
mgnify:CR=1 FL=1|tara:strand:+ start:9409 stop:9804 length:396 start_codon:yes stop_codon:yes gene_type:complete